MLNLTKLDKTEITTEGITHRWIQMAGNFTKAHRCVGSDSALQTVGLKVKHDIPFSYVENCRFFFFVRYIYLVLVPFTLVVCFKANTLTAQQGITYFILFYH